jgi:hypothetical protein
VTWVDFSCSIKSLEKAQHAIARGDFFWVDPTTTITEIAAHYLRPRDFPPTAQQGQDPQRIDSSLFQQQQLQQGDIVSPARATDGHPKSKALIHPCFSNSSCSKVILYPPLEQLTVTLNRKQKLLLMLKLLVKSKMTKASILMTMTKAQIFIVHWSFRFRIWTYCVGVVKLPSIIVSEKILFWSSP